MNSQYRGQAAQSGISRAQGAALELFQIAAMMLGSEEEAVALVEDAFAGVQADPCADADAAEDQALPRLLEMALRRLLKQSPEAFAIPPEVADSAACIDSEDLAAAGMDAIAALLQEPQRGAIRDWLDQLTPALRVIFVLRAIAGRDAGQTLELLYRSGASGAHLWSREQVGIAYRRALCSLANSLLTSNAHMAPA
jgi:hypothetical protein